MKKILLAFDGSNFSEGAFEFARRLSERQPVLLTGVFVPQVDYANLWSYSAVASAGGMYVPLVEEDDVEAIDENILRFERLCEQNGILYRVHKDFFDFAIPEIKKESRFSDVLIISGELFYKRFAESDQFDYLRDALHVSESPVIVVPEKYEFPTSNILAYDGSEESVYAIKQFAYIFPELACNKTLLVYANGDEKDVPSHESVLELVTQHYKDLTVFKFEANPRKYFSTWVNEERGSLLVSGAFGRSIISQVFKKSFVADIIRNHKLPVFIAHK
jgi:hypothetical protein